MIRMRCLSDMVEIQELKNDRTELIKVIDGLLSEMQMISDLAEEIKSVTDDEEIWELADFIDAMANGEVEETEEEELDLDIPEDDMIPEIDAEEELVDDPWMYRS